MEILCYFWGLLFPCRKLANLMPLSFIVLSIFVDVLIKLIFSNKAGKISQFNVQYANTIYNCPLKLKPELCKRINKTRLSSITKILRLFNVCI